MPDPIRIDNLPVEASPDRGHVIAVMLGGLARRLTVAQILGRIITADLPAALVTNAKLANMAQFRFKGRVSASPGEPEDLTATQLRDGAAIFGVVKVQKFTASGTYTPDAKMLFALLETVGATGGGGGCATSASAWQGGAGGGAGSTRSLKWVTKTDVGASKAVTVGAKGTGGAAGQNNGTDGGASSVGSLCTAPGGPGGTGAAASSGAAGGTAPAAGTGDVSTPGAEGWPGQNASGNGVSQILGGWGGRSGGGLSRGGKGGFSVNASTASRAGGDGEDGYVLITEFCSS